VPRPFAGHCPGKTGQPALGCRVGRYPVTALVGEERHNVDDAPRAAPQHLLAELLGQQEGRVEIDGEDFSPLRECELGCGRALVRRRVVDQQADFVLGGDGGGSPAGFTGIGQVGGNDGRCAASVADLLGHIVEPARRAAPEHDISTSVG
jgi:hypothetical protein